MYKEIKSMLELCETNKTVMPPSLLFNEGWMLRLVLNWFAKQNNISHELIFKEKSRWYSEVLLPSIFLPRSKKDKLSESYTHADGVIGDFTIGNRGKGDILLNHGINQFFVLEAKMFSKLSSGVSNAHFYNQATRNVACIAETLRISNIEPDSLDEIAFYVIAPEEHLHKDKSFKKYTKKNHIEETVNKRVEQYKDRFDYNEKLEWYNKWFLSTIKNIDIKCLSWEEIIEFINGIDASIGSSIDSFYKMCLKYNRKNGLITNK